MDVEDRKKELYEKHLHIYNESNKLKTHIDLVLQKSEFIIRNSLYIDDKLLLKQYTNIYKYLNNLHLELIDVNCRMELNFNNPQSDFLKKFDSKNRHNNYEIDFYKQLLLTDFLSTLQFGPSSSSSNSSISSNACLSTDSLLSHKDDNDNSKEIQKQLSENNISRTDNNIDSKNCNNKTSFKEIYSQKTTLDEIDASSERFFLRETNHDNPNQIHNLKINKTQNVLNNESVIDSHVEVKNNITNEAIKSDSGDCVNSHNLDYDNYYPEELDQNMRKISSVPEPKENDLCCLGYVESPSHFYIQLVCEEAINIDGHHEKIEEYVDNVPYYFMKSDAVSIFDPYCVCYCEKRQMWCRGKVIDWLLEDDELVIVQLIDYGNIFTAPLTNLREITDELCKSPTTIFKCKIEGIAPPEEHDEKWPKDSLKLFVDTLKPLEDRVFTLNYVEKIGDIFSVDLAIDSIPSIAAYMVLNKKAKIVYPDCDSVVSNVRKDILHKTTITKSLSTKDISESKKSEVETSSNTTKNISEPTKSIVDESSDTECEGACAVLPTDIPKKLMEIAKTRVHLKDSNMKQQIISSQGYNSDHESEDDDEEFINSSSLLNNYYPSDQRRVCKFINTRSGCWKGKDCRYSHDPYDPDGWTDDKLPIYYDAFNHLDLPGAGTTAKIKVKSIKDLRTFYVHIKSYPDKFNTFYKPVNSLKGLIEYMNSEEEVKKYKVPSTIPAYSQILLVNHYEKWLRARVVSIDGIQDSTSLKVFLVDYGETITVKTKDTREINEKLLHFPFQAVQCILHNTSVKKNNSEEFIENGLNFLEMCVLDKTLNARIMSTYDDCLQVLLYDENDQDIGEILVQHELLNLNDDFLPVGPCNINRKMID